MALTGKSREHCLPFTAQLKFLLNPLEGLLPSAFFSTHLFMLKVFLTMGFDTVIGCAVTFIFHIICLAVEGPLTSQTMFYTNNIIT